MLRHTSEVEQLFAKNIFGLAIKVTANTVGKTIHNTGKFTNLQELLAHLDTAAEVLEKAILSQADSDWQKEITTAEFCTVTKAEALARIISHSAYHARQVALILKYTPTTLAYFSS